TVLSSPAVPVADLVEGYKFPIIWVPIGVNKRYLRLNYTVDGSNATTGKVTAGSVMGVQTNVVAGVEGLGGTEAVRVEASKPGFNVKLRRDGDRFEVPDDRFSANWMRRLDELAAPPEQSEPESSVAEEPKRRGRRKKTEGD